ncbi:hypothetical protein [Deinococcus arenicola]|uniref:Uncharacterized protein n=1 Tax=Deinococcus arenicola TaxID=2994950 RepID=A0ABU4DWV3_9DEIO|nr:hypothetical protein [Deinococcus sp. ZS9-10]MDV6376432.1 hypothetical protein [Deinococcus sp. ZS9-10]
MTALTALMGQPTTLHGTVRRREFKKLLALVLAGLDVNALSDDQRHYAALAYCRKHHPFLPAALAPYVAYGYGYRHPVELGGVPHLATDAGLVKLSVMRAWPRHLGVVEVRQGQQRALYVDAPGGGRVRLDRLYGGYDVWLTRVVQVDPARALPSRIDNLPWAAQQRVPLAAPVHLRPPQRRQA